jgi:hypothetical protein
MAHLSTWSIVTGLFLTISPEPATSRFGLGLLVVGIVFRVFTDGSR